MPLLLKAILPLAVKLLTFFGLTITTYTGVHLGFDALKSAFISQKNLVAAEYVGLFDLLGFDTALSILLSALTIRVGIIAVAGSMSIFNFKGLSNG